MLPVLNAEAIDPAAPQLPAVSLRVTSDKQVYNKAQNETTALITAFVTDENQTAISGLPESAFVSTLDGLATTLTFGETATPGTYQTSSNIATWTEGDHIYNVTATDTRSLADNQSTTITITNVAAPTDPTIHVSSIAYALQGGKRSDRNLVTTITIQTDTGVGVSNALVAIDLFRDGILQGTGSAYTDTNGNVAFNLRNASSGCYSTTITNIVQDTSVWQQSDDVADGGFCKP